MGLFRLLAGAAAALLAYVLLGRVCAGRGTPAQAVFFRGAASLAAFGVVSALFVRGRVRAFWFPRARLLRDVVLGVCLAGVMAAMHGLAAKLYIEREWGGGMGELPSAAYNSAGVWDVFLIALGAGVLAPVGEEVFFRGFLYAGMRGVVRKGLAALLSALAFAAMHRPGMRAAAFLLGLAAAMAYERTRSLLPAVMMHMGANLAFVLFISNAAQVAGAVPYWLLAVAFALMNANLFVCGRALFARDSTPAHGAETR